MGDVKNEKKDLSMNILPEKFKADYKAMYRCEFVHDLKSYRRILSSGCMLMLLLGRLGEMGGGSEFNA